MTTLTDKSLLSGGDNKPVMLEKHLYDSWKSIMELYIMNRPHGRMILSSVEKEAIQADCDIKEINIILQGLPTKIYALVSQHRVAKDLWERIKLLMQGTSLTKQERECKLYNEFDKFTYKKGESLHEYYLIFTLLLNDMNIYKMPLEQFQVNTKFLNTLPDERSKFVTDVKLVKDLHTTNVDQLHAYLKQHERHANEVRLMHERNSDPLALSQQYSTHQSSTPLSVTYPSNDFQSSIHHNIYSPSSSIPQLEYPPQINQQSKFSQQDSGLIVLVFQKGDDPIDAINHMMSFLTAVVTSRYPTTNNQLRNSSNPRQQATINNGRVTLQPIQGRQTSFAAGTSRTYTPGASGSNSGKQRTVICYNCKGEVGNACPLTRITTTTEVPLKKSSALDNKIPKPAVTLVYSRKPWKSKNSVLVNNYKVIKSVTANNLEPSQSRGYIVSNVPSSYLDECRSSKLSSVAFRQHTCYIRNLEGVDLLTGSRGDNLYTLSLEDMMASSPICLLSKASKTKSWLWHRRLSHLNFGAINHLARHGLVRGLPKLKFEKDHLCSACALGKSTKKPYKPKFKDTNQEKLYLLHMDLCGPMCVASVNGKKYILVIVDDYSRFTWVKCLRSKDEAPAFIINFLKMIQVRLKETVRRIRTDNGTEFVNQTLREYYEKVGISHETSVARSPQQNGVVERRNCTLIEAALTMLIYAKAPLFILAEAVATACYTQNHSMIRLRHGKTPYELLHNKPPDLSYLHVFGALCYPTNDSENLGKLQPKADIGIFIGYAPTKKAFRIYNRRTRRIIETIHVDFDELTAMASEHNSSGPALYKMTLATISSRLMPNPHLSTPFVPLSRTDWDILFQQLFDEFLNPSPSVDHLALEVVIP
ncbi:retrovirus-related pol polyprotein from transposon TNT 1-94, partial [Tanacetum coccineum]